MEAVGGVAILVLMAAGLVLFILGILLPVFVYMNQKNTARTAAELTRANNALNSLLKEVRALNEETRGQGAYLARIGSGERGVSG